MWVLRLFGEFALEGDGVRVTNFGTVRAAKLLALLALSREGRLPREQLAELLWPDDFYDATRLRLRQELHRLRRAIAPADSLVDATASDVVLDRSALRTDLDLLDSSPLPTGEFLAGWDDAWAVAERRAAEERLLEAVMRKAEVDLASGRHQEALTAARAMIPRHPHREDLRMVVVRAHAAAGSLVNAVSEYQTFRRELREALGMDPSAASEAVMERLRNDPPPAPSVAPTPLTAPTEALKPTLPNPLEPLIGRIDALKEIQELLTQGETRLLTLVGPGGIGKTRLAVEAARRISEQTTTRVAFVALAESTDPSQWARIALTQLGVSLPGNVEPRTYLANVLDRNPTLLVLDNLETLLPDIAGEVRRLLEATKQLRVLATSIMPLKVGGEATIAVGPLDPATEGRAMLAAALRAFRPLAATRPEADAALAEVASRLDGYPLALKLASARLRLLSPEALLGQLDRPEVLASASPDVVDRHRSVESALATSLRAISPDDRSALDALSAFPGGVGLDLGAHLLPQADLVDRLERLLDAALLSLDDRGAHVRVRLLGPIRGYIRSRLSPEQSDTCDHDAVRACLAYVRGLDAGPYQPLQSSTLAGLDPEAENLRAATHWATDHAPEAALELLTRLLPFEIARGRAAQLPPAFDRLRTTWQDGAQAEAEAEVAIAEATLSTTFTLEALRHIERAETLAADQNNPALHARVKLVRAAYAFRREFETAYGHADQAVSLALAAGLPHLAARAHRILGMWQHFRHAPDRAIPHLEESLRLAMANGETLLDGDTRSVLAMLLWQAGRKQDALQSLREARERITTTGTVGNLAHLYETEGRIALDDGRPEDAEMHFRESHRIWSTIGSDFQEADQLLSISRSLIAQGRCAEAEGPLRASAQKWALDRNDGGLCASLAALADLLDSRGLRADAQRVLGFYREYQNSADLVIIKPEIEYRESIAQRIGGYAKAEGPYNLSTALELFELMR